MAQLGRFLILYHHQLLIDGPSTSNPYSLLLCVVPPSSSDLIFRLFLSLSLSDGNSEWVLLRPVHIEFKGE